MIEEIKTVADGGNPQPETPPQQPETPPNPRGKGRKPPRTDKPVTEIRTHGSDRAQLAEKYGEERADQILDAAAGRRPPFTQNLDPTKAPPEEELTGPRQDRGPLHLLPTPLSFNMKADQFFKYWFMLTMDERQRVKVRPYRLWPKTDVMLLLTPEEREKILRKERREPTKTLPPGPLQEPFDPQNWRTEICHRYGAGDYNFILTDTHPLVQRTICMTNIIGELRDMDTYPPKVDPRTLVVSDPGNESYVRWCHMKNIRIPGKDGEDYEEADMPAQVKVIDRAFDSMEKQNAELRAERREQREREAKERAEAAKQSGSDAVSSTAKAVLDSIQGAAAAGQKMLMDSIAQVNKEKDPVAYHAAVMETAKSLSGGGNNDKVIEMITKSNEATVTAIKESNTTVMTLILGNQKALEMRLEAAEKRNTELQSEMMKLTIASIKGPDQSAGNSLTSKNPMDMLGEMSKMMTTVLNFADKLSDRNPRGADGGSIWARIADKVVDVAPNIMHNWAAAQQAMAAVKGIKTTDPQLPPAQGEEEGETDNRVPTEEEMALKFLDQIEQPILHALSAGASGQEFGAVLMKSHGADVYEFIASLGDDQLFGLLRQNQSIWSTVQKMPDRFTMFLAEFRDRKTVTAVFQRMNNLTQQAPPPPPSPQPQPQAPPPQPQPANRPAAPKREAAPAGNGAPAQVTRRLKPGQRVVHTPTGQMVVDATATTVPDNITEMHPQTQPPSPPPPQPPQAETPTPTPASA